VECGLYVALESVDTQCVISERLFAASIPAGTEESLELTQKQPFIGNTIS